MREYHRFSWLLCVGTPLDLSHYSTSFSNVSSGVQADCPIFFSRGSGFAMKSANQATGQPELAQRKRRPSVPVAASGKYLLVPAP